MTDPFPAAQHHEAIQSLGDEVFWVPGTMRLNPLLTISRNMVIVREGTALTLINAMRLNPPGEAALAQLGEVRHVVRLGCFHGLDDAYLRQRFNARFWCQADSRTYPDPAPDQLLEADGPLPFEDAKLLVFNEIKRPECALLIQRGPGILVTCDCLQNYADWSRHSLPARLMMPMMGFRRGLQVGPLWKKVQTPERGSIRPDYERLLALEFDALISGHGQPLMQGARAAAGAAVARAFD